MKVTGLQNNTPPNSWPGLAGQPAQITLPTIEYKRAESFLRAGRTALMIQAKTAILEIILDANGRLVVRQTGEPVLSHDDVVPGKKIVGMNNRHRMAVVSLTSPMRVGKFEYYTLPSGPAGVDLETDEVVSLTSR